MRTFIVTAAIGCIAWAGLADEAFAHAQLKSAVPAVDGMVHTAPTELDLHFTEAVNLKFTGVVVSGPDNPKVATGDARLMDNDDTTLVVPISGTLGPGKYTVEWHALATDGHKTQGTFTFIVMP